MNSMPYDILLSFAFHGNRQGASVTNADLAELRKVIGPEALMMIDSGAYTAFTSGQKIDLADYASFLKDWEGTFDCAITLDVIGDPVQTMKNTRMLWDMGIPVLPVHTGAASFESFDKLCNETDYIAIGGLAGSKVDPNQQRRYVAGLVHHAARRGVACHILGAGSGRMIRAAGAFSSDVALPSRTVIHGKLFLYDARKGGMRAVQVSNVAEVKQYRQMVVDHGLRLDDLLSGHIFDKLDGRNRVIQACSRGLLALGYDLRKRLNAPPPARFADRMRGPRVLNAMVTIGGLRTTNTVVDNGELVEPTARILERRSR